MMQAGARERDQWRLRADPEIKGVSRPIAAASRLPAFQRQRQIARRPRNDTYMMT